MNQIITKTHSKLGIVSSLIAIFTWLYLATMIYLIFFNEGFVEKIGGIFLPQSQGFLDFSGIAAAMIWVAFLFLVIPSISHLTGLILGLIATIQTKKKKFFGIVGLIMNGLIFFLAFLFYIVGSFT